MHDLPAVGRHEARYRCQPARPRLVVVLSECHSRQWAERRSVASVDRIPALPDSVANVDSRPGIASSDYMICPVQRCRLRLHCKVLQLIN